MAKRKTVVIGLLGPQLDAGVNARRWERWRPTVPVCQHDDLLVDRFHLLVEPKFSDLAQTVSDDLASVSPDTKVVKHEVPFKDPWDFEEVFSTLHDFARSTDFKPEDEDYLVHITTGTHVAQICLFLLTESRHLPGRLLQTSPRKGGERGTAGGVYSIIDLDLSRYDRLATRFQLERDDSLSFLKSGIATRNEKFNCLIEQIEKVALNSDAPILLTGPTGAGKSQLARRIFEMKQHRQRVAGKLVELNCAVIRGDQAASALFGHVKGAFTGAAKDREGLLRAADGGMLFLDEIGELGLDEQAMLLRAVEEKRFLPVGADKESSSDFQLIAGTNRDLRSEVLEGTFREDLLARINLWTFELPSLADRREDLEPNIEYELERFESTDGRRVTFNREARQRFLKFAESGDATWNANFRDLSAAVTRMATLAPAGRITVDVVNGEVDRLKYAWSESGQDSSSQVLKSVLSDEQILELDLYDQSCLAKVVEVCKECRSMAEAGRRLFAVSRRAKAQPNDSDRVKKLLGRFGLSWRDIHPE